MMLFEKILRPIFVKIDTLVTTIIDIIFVCTNEGLIQDWILSKGVTGF